MNFFEAVRTCFQKSVTFKGRALRSEYWYFVLFTFLVEHGLEGLNWLCNSETLYEYLNLIYLIFFGVTFLPGCSVTVRRLHDSGCNGWLVLLAFTVIGWLPLICLLFREGDPGPNAYGDPVLPKLTPAPEETRTPESQVSTSTPSPSPSTQLESRNGVNMANDLRDTTK